MSLCYTYQRFADSQPRTLTCTFNKRNTKLKLSIKNASGETKQKLAGRKEQLKKSTLSLDHEVERVITSLLDGIVVLTNDKHPLNKTAIECVGQAFPDTVL